MVDVGPAVVAATVTCTTWKQWSEVFPEPLLLQADLIGGYLGLIDLWLFALRLLFPVLLAIAELGLV